MLERGHQEVLLALTRTVGIGFLAAAVGLIAVPVLRLLGACAGATYAPTSTALVFCACLAVVNRRLHDATGAGTPWRESAVAAALLALALVLTPFTG